MGTEPTIEVWQDPPQMDVGAPEPVLLADGLAVWVAYRTRGTDDLFAVVRFDGVAEHRLGPPSDERLEEHPLYRHGLRLYAFHAVWEAMADPYALLRWVVTFHDETLEVSGGSVTVVSRGVQAKSGRGALAAVVPGGV